MLTTASAMPPNEDQRAGGLQVCGRRKRVASTSSSSTSVSAAIAMAAITLPAISEEAWWLKNLTSAARGLIGRVGDALERRREALQQADGRRAVERRAGDDPAQQVEKAAGERGHAEAAAPLGLTRDLLVDLASAGHRAGAVYDERMEGGGLGDLFGDPEELQRRLAEFADQMQGQQKLAWADNAIKLAVDMTVAAVERINLQGNAEAQAEQIRTVMALVFPEAVTLVREARAGLQ